MFESSTEDRIRQKRRRLPNLYMQYRLLHAFWSPNGGPSREYTKTTLQMAMNASYRTFVLNFEFALENDLVRPVETGMSRVYAITNKGVSVHNELELVFSLLFEKRPEIDLSARADNGITGFPAGEIKAEKVPENQLTWAR